jgi:hypothetical protein
MTGWQDDDEVTTTYRSLRQGMNEAAILERERVIKLLIELNAIRRDALGHLVAFNTDGTEVIYLTGLENE